jgi:hypothetical protein
LGDQIKKNEMGEGCSAFGGKRRAYRVLVEKRGGKRPLERTWHRLEDNIDMHLQQVGWGPWTELIWFGTVTGGRLL